MLRYQDATGLSPHWLSSLTIDLDAQTFSARATGIVLSGLANPFAVQFGVDEAVGCSMARLRDLGDGSYQWPGGDDGPCLIPQIPVTDKILAGAPAKVTVRVQGPIDSTVDPGSLTLYRADEHAQPAGDPLCLLSDAGGGSYSCSVLFNEASPSTISLLVQGLAAGRSIVAPGAYVRVVKPGDDNDLRQLSAVQDFYTNDDSFAQFGDTPRYRIGLLAALRAMLDPQPRLNHRRVGLAPDGLSVGARSDSGGGVMLVLNRSSEPSVSEPGPARTLRAARCGGK